MTPYRPRFIACFAAALSLLLLFSAGCATHTGQQAGKSAAIAGMAGAAGGALSAAIFGGNVGQAAARGAAWGAGSGAVTGAIAGAQMDEKAQNTPEAKIARLKKDIGEDAFNGLAALADCKYDLALSHARMAQASPSSEFVAAGMWVEAMTYYDGRQETKARAMYPEIFKMDKNISTENQAEEHIRKALDQIMETREKHGRSRVCK